MTGGGGRDEAASIENGLATHDMKMLQVCIRLLRGIGIFMKNMNASKPSPAPKCKNGFPTMYENVRNASGYYADKCFFSFRPSVDHDT